MIVMVFRSRDNGATVQDAQTLDQITQTALSLINPLKEQLDDMAFDLSVTRGDLESAINAIEREEARNMELSAQLAVLEATHTQTLKKLGVVESMVERLRRRNQRLLDAVTLLVNQIMMAGIQPVITMEELDGDFEFIDPGND